MSKPDRSTRIYSDSSISGELIYGVPFLTIITDAFDDTKHIHQIMFDNVKTAEEMANQLLQAVFEHTEKKFVKNKRDITEEEWRIIDEKRWAEIRNKILDFSCYIDLHSFIKTLSVFEIHDGSSLYLESNAFVFISIDILLRSCMAIWYADSVDYNDDGDIVEIGERLWSIHINFKNTKQKEFEYMQ
jgi:hypothetical protein